MAKVTEFRIHGVSGTPPASMLKTQPLVVETRPGPEPYEAAECAPDSPKKRLPIEVTRPPESPSLHDDHEVRAYNWSRLTSGKARYAFWLLLLPYTLMNAAGWMLPPRDDSADGKSVRPVTGRVLDIAVRIAGALVTAVFMLFSTAIMFDLVLAQCQPGTDSCKFVNAAPKGTPTSWLVAGSLLIVAAVGVVFFYVANDRKRRHQSEVARDQLSDEQRPSKPGNESTDPVLHSVSDNTFWVGRSLTTWLAVLHASAAVISVSWVLAVIHLETDGASIGLWAVMLATIALVVAFIAASTWAPSDGLKRWSVGVGVVAALAFILGLVDIASLNVSEWGDIKVREGLSSVSVVLTLTLAVIGAGVWIVGAKARLTTSGAASMIVLSGLIGSSFGAGAYMLVRQFLIGGQGEIADIEPLGGIDWAALGFLAFLLVQVGAIVFTMAFDRRRKGETRPIPMAGLRFVTNKIKGHLKYPAAFALLGSAVFLFKEVRRLGDSVNSPFEADPDALTLYGWLYSDFLILILMVIVTVVVMFAATRYLPRLWAWGVVVVVVIGVVLLVVAKPTDVSLAGVTLDLMTFQAVAVSLALLVPIGFVVSRVWTMLRDSEQRRGIGILWDLGSFWPRWYHPFAAPTYSPVAIPDLAATIRTAAGNQDEVLVAAHSQGSIVAMAALLTIEPDEVDLWQRVSLLTYGNPLCQLYAQLFPAQFNEVVIADLCGRLTDADDDPRWFNLWRQTDPIGGPISHLGDRDWDIDVCLQDGHSGYELTDKFRQAQMTLLGIPLEDELT